MRGFLTRLFTKGPTPAASCVQRAALREGGGFGLKIENRTDSSNPSRLANSTSTRGIEEIHHQADESGHLASARGEGQAAGSHRARWLTRPVQIKSRLTLLGGKKAICRGGGPRAKGLVRAGVVPTPPPVSR